MAYDYKYENNPPAWSDLVLCPNCKGLGRVGKEVCIDYHRRDYDTVYSECKRCDCTGRLYKTTKVTYRKMNE